MKRGQIQSGKTAKRKTAKRKTAETDGTTMPRLSRVLARTPNYPTGLRLADRARLHLPLPALAELEVSIRIVHYEHVYKPSATQHVRAYSQNPLDGNVSNSCSTAARLCITCRIFIYDIRIMYRYGSSMLPLPLMPVSVNKTLWRKIQVGRQAFRAPNQGLECSFC